MAEYSPPAMLNLASTGTERGVSVVIPTVIAVLSLWLLIWPWVLAASGGR